MLSSAARTAQHRYVLHAGVPKAHGLVAASTFAGYKRRYFLWSFCNVQLTGARSREERRGKKTLASFVVGRAC